MSIAMAKTDSTIGLAEAYAPGLIGPNAVIQLGEALLNQLGRATALRIYYASGCESLLDAPPDRMVDERIPARLFDQLWRELPATTARSVAYEAGMRTGRYVLENRIPRLVHIGLNMLPPSIASRQLLSAIEKNAWTFAGSGECRTTVGMPAVIEIFRNPLRMPGGVWHEAVFSELLGMLVSRTTNVRFTPRPGGIEECCRFEIRF